MSHKPWNIWGQQKLGETKKLPPLQPRPGAQLCSHLGLRLLVSRAVGTRVCVVVRYGRRATLVYWPPEAAGPEGQTQSMGHLEGVWRSGETRWQMWLVSRPLH